MKDTCKFLGTLFTGVVLVTVLVPALQWMSRGATGNSAELDTPTPIAVGLLTGLIAVSCILTGLRATKRFSPKTLVILYVMMTASLPFCNTGLVQGFYASLTAVASEHLDRQIPTIREGYRSQNPGYFPKLTDEDYAEYQALGRQIGENPEDSADLQARQREILKPLKRFWSGVGIDPETKEALDQADASWFVRMQEASASVPWRMWAPLLFSWGALMLLLLAGVLLLAHRLGRIWIEKENLSFPVAQLAVSLIGAPEDGEDTDAGIFRNAYFRGGSLIAAFLLLLGGLAHYQILDLPVTGAVTFQRMDFSAILVTPPWNVLSNNLLLFSPLMVGLFLLVHQDILKGGLWVFLVLMGVRFAAGLGETSLRQVFGAGWQGNAFPYLSELGTGAVILFSMVLIWKHRHAVLGSRLQWFLWAALLLGVGGWWYRQGVEGWGGLFFLLFFLSWTWFAGIALMRARAEGGLPTNSTALVGSKIAYNTGSVGTHGIHNVMAFNHSFFFTLSTLPGLMATTLEGLYLGHRFNVPARKLMIATALAFIVAVGVGWVSFLLLSYAHGSQYIQPFLQRMVRFPLYDTFHAGDVVYQSGSDPLRVMMIPVGALVMGALIFIRRRSPRFPVPPLSFLLICLGTISFQRAGAPLHHLHAIPINIVWGPILIALIIKSLVLRFGGMDLYVRSRPCALGLVFGHAMMILVWNVFHAITTPDMNLFTGVFQ